MYAPREKPKMNSYSNVPRAQVTIPDPTHPMKPTYLISSKIVVHDEVIPIDDMILDPVADGALLDVAHPA